MMSPYYHQSLTEINDILDNHFAECFGIDDPMCEYNFTFDKQYEDSIYEFLEAFEELYNSENVPDCFFDIKNMCNFNMTMKICEYVADKYEELFDIALDKSYFEDNEKILKAYIYYYMLEVHKPIFHEKLEILGVQ